MKRAYILLAVLVLAAGCGDSDTAPAADDNREQYTATLLTANEVPPIPNAAEAGAAGMAHIDFNLTKDAAGAITAANVHFRVDLTDFPATSAITAAHIHTGAAGRDGTGAGQHDRHARPGHLVGAAWGHFPDSRIMVDPAVAQSIINNPAGFYFNVHTSANPRWCHPWSTGANLSGLVR